MTPGAKIAFAAVDIETAEAAARALAGEIADLPSRMVPVARKHSIDVDKLLGENLISGAVDARADPGASPNVRHGATPRGHSTLVLDRDWY